MITYPATNLFNALSPMLEDLEEEVLFKHPIEDISCNQLGTLFLNEDLYFILHIKSGCVVRRRNRTNVGSKSKVVWECYSGKIYDGPGSPHFLHYNGNVLDFTFDNLKLSNDLNAKDKRIAKANRAKFNKLSVDHLIKLEAQYLKRGIKKLELYDTLNLPTWLTSARRKRPEINLEPKPKMAYKGNKCKTTVEEVDMVIKLYNLGLTYYNISLKMGWNSTSRIKTIVKKYNLPRRKS